jgi:tRNA dimethylallyltransferase
MSDPVLVVILGPTASGKTALSLHLAERFAGEIVSCDSVAVYREFEIGTAKPSREERGRVAHHLIDVVEPTGFFTAGDYSRAARQAVAEIGARGRLPIIVGGTGLYLRALLEGLFPGPPRSEELRARLRERAAERGAPYLHKLLRRLDSQAAQAVHANDVAKTIRALEVSITARRPITDLWQQGREPLRGFRILRIGLDPDRAALYERINQRAERMFSAGLIEETRLLADRYGAPTPSRARAARTAIPDCAKPAQSGSPGARDPGAAARPLTSLGYKQALEYLRGELSLEQAIQAAQQGHRNYAKRQMTWFRREPEVEWFAGFGSDPQIQQRVENLVASRKQEGG